VVHKERAGGGGLGGGVEGAAEGLEDRSDVFIEIAYFAGDGPHQLGLVRRQVRKRLRTFGVLYLVRVSCERVAQLCRNTNLFPISPYMMVLVSSCPTWNGVATEEPEACKWGVAYSGGKARLVASTPPLGSTWSVPSPSHRLDLRQPWHTFPCEILLAKSRDR
jgi:hypothetical protein